MEKLSKETLSVMSKEELQEAVEALQLKLDVAEREIEKLKQEAEIGRKYLEHLKAEAVRLIRAVEGEGSPFLKLIEKADVETLKMLVDEYMQKAKEKFKATASKKDSETLTAETLIKADYDELLRLKARFMNGL